MPATLSVAMIARNEEKNLPRTLSSVRWADEIVIVDSGSVDRTPEIAREFGAKHSFNRNFEGHPQQKTIAINQCTSDWILLLDADEVVTPELAAEIRQVLEKSEQDKPEFTAYWLPRLNLFMDRWVRHGGFYPDHKLRLFKRGSAVMDVKGGPHGTPQHEGPKGTLKNDLLHYAYPDFELYLSHMNDYSTETLDVLVRRGKAKSTGALIWLGVVNPFFTFIKNYIFRGGFLDGTQGLIYHLNHSAYIHWKYAKAWYAQKVKEVEP
ncbi:glycosyltransferase family 2 protein [Silvibacterium dinghuense]|uniref:Glycosyltransferase family 2 protein n=1 Tax=Silvibacterium dinghuense TaxID=1560006 RepID=A0A4Q1SHS4_9BACT|nr:glycosyltransferase family 2 protein [Silvibacterium dinghuense]RXS97116.1 glycosyltransferase family 2 protein [Silvibacterium dinghuense]GGG96388.1 glycosyl transferase family 2 [Silvibacterium dinghuense]